MGRPGTQTRRAYEFTEGDKGEGVPRGLLEGQLPIVFNTSNTESGREKTVFGDPLEAIWKNCVFRSLWRSDSSSEVFNVVITKLRGGATGG